MRPYLLKGHERPLTQVKYNREGDLLVSCAKDLQPCLWFAEDGLRIGTYEGHNGAVWSCEFDIDSTRLITSSADQTVRIWDLPTGQELHQIKMGEPCRSCSISVGEQLLAFTTDSFMGSPPQIHIVDVNMADPSESAAAPRFSIECPKGRVTRVYWTDCNRTLITSHNGGWVSWDGFLFTGVGAGAGGGGVAGPGRDPGVAAAAGCMLVVGPGRVVSVLDRLQQDPQHIT